jgi:hypothetical protein
MSEQGESVGADTDAEPRLSIEAATGDFLLGADEIRGYLVSLGFPKKIDPYYLKKTGWPIGNTGGNGGGFLIAMKRRLARHAEKLASS